MKIRVNDKSLQRNACELQYLGMEFDRSDESRCRGLGNPRCALTPGQLEIIARIANNSITSYKQRKEASLKYQKPLREAREVGEKESDIF